MALAASLLVPVDIVTMLLLGPWTEIVARAVYMSATYGALGLLLVRHAPECIANNSSNIGPHAAEPSIKMPA